MKYRTIYIFIPWSYNDSIRSKTRKEKHKHMKKTLALILALMLVLALFAGCNNGGGTTTPTSAPATQAPATKAPATQAPGSNETPAPVEEDEGPYHLAAGKYEKDADGFPVEKYEYYPTPLCENDSILTDWTVCYTPQYIPEEGWENIPTWKMLREYTGVHVEYMLVDSANRSENFSVLLASDELPDMMDGAVSFYKQGTLKNAIEDGYFANFYDYRDYLPNYMWEINNRAKNNKNVMGKVFYDKTTIPALYGLVCDPCSAMGYFLRQDWMDDLGLGKAEDIKTYDQVHDVVTAFKVNESNNQYNNSEIYPFFIMSVVETYQGQFFSGMDITVYTASMMYPRIIDGKVEFCGSTEDDREAMTLLSTWYAEGLISPNFHSFESGSDYDAGQHTDGVGCNLMTVSQVVQSERQCNNPNAHWEPITRTKRTEDQVIKYGYAKAADDFSYASCCVSAKCNNIPLACSWIDFGFSDFGSDFTSWGPEGICWEYNDQGERRLTDWCVNHEATASWIMCIYAYSGLSNCCLFYNYRSNYTDDGIRTVAIYEALRLKDYKGEYDWPTAVNFDDEEREENTSIFADLNTYFTENYGAFIDGSKPMAEWDSYVQGLYDFGLSDVVENYQAAYERLLARDL